MKVYPHFDRYLVSRNKGQSFFSFFCDGKPLWTKLKIRAQHYHSDQEAKESIERIKAAGKRGGE